FFFFQAEDGIRDATVTGVQTCALPIYVQWVTEELRWLGGALGPARNLDVFAAELVPPARTGLPDEPGWDDLAAALDRRRVAAYEIGRASCRERVCVGVGVGV